MTGSSGQNGRSGDRPISTALLLAAGKGTRIRSVRPELPKPLLPVAGRSALERNLLQLAAAGVGEVWINLHYRGRRIEEAVGDGSRYGLRVRYSWEPELLGTAGAAKKIEAGLSGGTFAVVYGDNLIALDLAAMVARHRQAGAVATIAVFDRERVPNTGLAGGRVILGADNRVARFEEGGPSESPYVNAGVYVLEPSVLAAIPAATFCDFGRDVFPALLQRGSPVLAYPIDGYCLAIDTPEALAQAERLIHQIETGASRAPAAGARYLQPPEELLVP